ncbi:hypothetical protein [Spirosoma panaciterrae]|uniref:hypothetical protein n=1 Tax=Spirosoma panaciterrae TaxID=496058 RepID=UPI00035C845E|nr:hypothetical protein [Spirosoma panaciterrae]
METQIKTVSEEINQLLAKGNELIAQAERLIIQKNGQTYSLDEWITPTEYVKRFNLKTTMVISNWIRRGVIPQENILSIPELNNLRLIKAVPYQE